MFLREPLNVDMNFKEGFVEIQAAASDPPHKLLHSKNIWQKKGQWCVQYPGNWSLKYSAFLENTPQVTGCETIWNILQSTNQIPSLKMPSLQVVCLLSYKVSDYISDTDMKTWISTF